MLKFSVLASGSSGNSVYIESETTRLLLDAGISAKQLQLRLRDTANVSLDALDAVLITHEHVDHVRGIRQVAKQTRAPLYSTAGTWHHVKAALDEETDAQRCMEVQPGHAFVIGDIRVTPFAVSHDAEEPVAYRFDSADGSLTVLTDLGYVSDAIKSAIYGCDCYVLETNHDVDMLRAGRYPWSLKRRILGDKGHLSNQDAGEALADLLGTNPVSVYLAHLSEENNQPDLATLTVQTVLREIKPSYAEHVTLHMTSRYSATPLHTL